MTDQISTDKQMSKGSIAAIVLSVLFLGVTGGLVYVGMKYQSATEELDSSLVNAGTFQEQIDECENKLCPLGKSCKLDTDITCPAGSACSTNGVTSCSSGQSCRPSGNLCTTPTHICRPPGNICSVAGMTCQTGGIPYLFYGFSGGSIYLSMKNTAGSMYTFGTINKMDVQGVFKSDDMKKITITLKTASNGGTGIGGLIFRTTDYENYTAQLILCYNNTGSYSNVDQVIHDIGEKGGAMIDFNNVNTALLFDADATGTGTTGTQSYVIRGNRPNVTESEATVVSDPNYGTVVFPTFISSTAGGYAKFYVDTTSTGEKKVNSMNAPAMTLTNINFPVKVGSMEFTFYIRK